MMSNLIISLLASYLLGAIPTALIAGRVIGKIDIRQHGSGNAGATNVYRLFGMKAYLAVLSLDMLKGFVAVAVVAGYGAGLISPERTGLYCGMFAVIGHIWTVFAGFKGGKGVATAGGVFLGLNAPVALAAIGVYLLVTLTTKYVSLGSMTAAAMAPVFLLIDERAFGRYIPGELYAASVLLAALIVYTHRENIRRLMKGEERKTEFLSREKE